MSASEEVRRLTLDWVCETAKYKYTYNFTWLGRPIIQLPADIIAMQEIIWQVKPELVIETGIARGGSLIFYASLLEMLGGDGRVVGVDVDIRQHNRVGIEAHPMFKRITMIEGSSTDEDVVRRVYEQARGKSPVLVVLDSSHTHEHVLRELELYSPLVTKGSYLVVLDTIIEDMPDEFFAHRPWGRGNNPKTAVRQFLKASSRFQIDHAVEDKLLISVAPDGYLRCVRE
ncbi:MAG: cephalosporin hydroxylase [Chloroflexota bacterium]|nr:MAG: cephalosporin hydroxylase [Chloroflexota bacterium]